MPHMTRFRRRIARMIPPSFLYTAVHFWKTLGGGFHKKFYSENGEDIFLQQRIFPSKINGFYVDVGAFHPKLLSNTYGLHKRGWRGINIEPNADALKLFRKYRKGDVNLQVGVATVPGTATYYRFSHAGCNTLSPEYAEHMNKKSWSVPTVTEQIVCERLDSIFAKHVPHGQTIDLLDVDVEGRDLDVLKSNDWARFRPLIVMVEDAMFVVDEPNKSEIYMFMHDQRYKLVAFFGTTLVFERLDRIQ